MSLLKTAQFVTGGNIEYGWYDNQRKAGVIRERVAFAGNAPFAALTRQLPPGARIIWTAMKNPSALTPRAASSASATNTIQMGIALVATAPTSLATNSATSNIQLLTPQTAFGGTIPSNSAVRNFAVQGATTAGGLAATSFQTATYNDSTNAVTLYLVPYASTVSTDANGVGRFYVAGTTAATTQYTMNGTATTTSYIDVTIQFEQFIDNPDN